MKRFKNILVSVDSRFDDRPPLNWAKLIAEHNQAKLTLVDVQREIVWPVRLALRDYKYVQESEIENKRERLEAFALPIRESGIEVSTTVPIGSTSIEIIREVLRNKHDLVVRASKGVESRREGFFGSTTMRLLRKCPSAVWAVSAKGTPRCQNVLAAVDITPGDANHAQLNKAIMELAMTVSQWRKGRYDVIHVWSQDDAKLPGSRPSKEEIEEHVNLCRRQVEEEYEAFLARHDLSMKSDNAHLLNGRPESAILNFIKENQTDLVILGTVARTGIPGIIMGNTAERLLGSIQCSVLALKPDAFVSPVTLDDE